jgi:hypothetical protein
LSGIAGTILSDLLSSVTQQWGNMSQADLASLIDKFNQPGLKNFLEFCQFIILFNLGGLHHIWTALDDHCNSHFDCGPDACCLQPTVHGKRGFTDGGMICFYEIYFILILSLS